MLRNEGMHEPARKKHADNRLDNRYDYRLTLFTHTSFGWIYDSFYLDIDGVKTKVVPSRIGDYLTPCYTP